jgi:hypothetical protein
MRSTDLPLKGSHPLKKRHLAVGGIVAGAVIATGVASGSTLAGRPDRPSADRADQPTVVLAEGLELLSSATAEDWVAYGSAVVVVTVVGERAGEVVEGDRQYEEGTVNRDVDLRVDQRIWVRPDAEVPDQITIGTTGWAWSEGDPMQRVEFVNAGRPRYELGKQYLVALAEWPATPEDRLASCEDEPEMGGWAPIGQFASTPVTDGIIGVGEFEGTERSLNEALEAADRPEDAMAVEGGSLRGLLTGKSVHAVAPVLKLAASTTSPREIPVPGC